MALRVSVHLKASGCKGPGDGGRLQYWLNNSTAKRWIPVTELLKSNGDSGFRVKEECSHLRMSRNRSNKKLLGVSSV